MDKRFIYLLIFLGVVAGIGLGIAFSRQPNTRPSQGASMGQQQLGLVRQPWQVLDSFYMAELALGVKEHPDGSNRGKRIGYYQETVGVKPGSMWCAAFSYTGHYIANIPAYRSAWTPDWAIHSDVVYKKGKYFRKVRPGDFILVYSHKKKRFDHITNIHTEDGGYYITIGGNESNSVRMGRTHKDQVDFIGSYTDRVMQ